jgi:hypothetical protein
MADIVDVRTGPREVTEFLTLEGSSPIRIHTCLRCVYGEDAIDVRSVRLWVRRFKNSKRDGDDRSRNSRPDTIATETTTMLMRRFRNTAVLRLVNCAPH